MQAEDSVGCHVSVIASPASRITLHCLEMNETSVVDGRLFLSVSSIKVFSSDNVITNAPYHHRSISSNGFVMTTGIEQGMSRTFRRNWYAERQAREKMPELYQGDIRPDNSCPSTCICKMDRKRQGSVPRKPTRQEIRATR